MESSNENRGSVNGNNVIPPVVSTSNSTVSQSDNLCKTSLVSDIFIPPTVTLTDTIAKQPKGTNELELLWNRQDSVVGNNSGASVKQNISNPEIVLTETKAQVKDDSTLTNFADHAIPENKQYLYSPTYSSQSSTSHQVSGGGLMGHFIGYQPYIPVINLTGIIAPQTLHPLQILQNSQNPTTQLKEQGFHICHTYDSHTKNIQDRKELCPNETSAIHDNSSLQNNEDLTNHERIQSYHHHDHNHSQQVPQELQLPNVSSVDRTTSKNATPFRIQSANNITSESEMANGNGTGDARLEELEGESIASRVEQALDLAKNHILYVVREEVRMLQEKITTLLANIERLEVENALLRRETAERQVSRRCSDGKNSPQSIADSSVSDRKVETQSITSDSVSRSDTVNSPVDVSVATAVVPVTTTVVMITASLYVTPPAVQQDVKRLPL